MVKFYYVKGEPVPNAQRYELWKGTTKKENNVDVFVPTNKIGEQEILQQLSIAGTIAASGRPAEKQNTVSVSSTSNKKPITLTPITELTEDGYVYYIRLEGTMAVDSYANGLLRGIPFSGKLYIAYPDAIDLEVYNLIQGYTDPSTILLECQWKKHGETAIDGQMDVNVFAGLTGDVISVGVENGTLTAYSAHTEYRRTDFIPISELTNHLRTNDSTDFACVGAFSNGNGEMPGYKMAFYGGMSYSTFKAGFKYSDFNKPYLTAEEVSAKAPSDANYVIFSSAVETTANGSNADFVSVGGINFLLTGKTDVEVDDILAVKAIGDGVFFADSEFSEPKTYEVQ